MKIRILAAILIVALLAACGPDGGAPPVATTEPPPAPTDAPPAATEPPAETQPAETEPAETPPPTEPAQVLSTQPAGAQRIEFQAEDGVTLVGYFYPSKFVNAPVVVLMHWAGGDQTDWMEVGLVQWLQNRLDENPIPAGQVEVYPPMPEALSFSVFTFDFRTFGESDPMAGVPYAQITPGWVMDAKAAYATAATMPEVDPSRVAGIGSSIGADGVVDGCDDNCIGALSLSPGNYLALLYTDEVKRVDEAGKPVWCVAAEGDGPAYAACSGSAGEHYLSKFYPGDIHGTAFLMPPNNPPDIGQVILDWLKTVFSLD
ncbi:MAG: hypothetical protein AB1846_15680 [Chloroflexota bacterium]